MEYYRYEDKRYSCGNEESGFYTKIQVQLLKFNVIRETPKGVRIEQYSGDYRGRVVLHNSRRKYANPTIEEAKESFIARKERQIKILKKQLKDVEFALSQVSR
jgi:hypothetical protein